MIIQRRKNYSLCLFHTSNHLGYLYDLNNAKVVVEVKFLLHLVLLVLGKYLRGKHGEPVDEEHAGGAEKDGGDGGDDDSPGGDGEVSGQYARFNNSL